MKDHLDSRDWLIDVFIACAAFLVAYLQLYLSTSPIVFTDDLLRSQVGIIVRDPSAATYIALAATTLPLVFRRKFPWPSFLLVFVVFSSAQDTSPGYAFSVIGPAISMFTIVYERPKREIITAGIVAFILLLIARIPSDNDTVAAVVRIQNISYVIASMVAGVAARTYVNYVAAIRQRAEEAERTRDAEAARRVEEERLRIAREIHDITAHSLSAVSIQAAAAERLLDRDPDMAREAVRQVRQTSKTALEEIRSMIGVLRNEGQEAETRPTNGTDRIPDLLQYARNAGLAVHEDVAGYNADGVPAYADLALFGIAREAITNVVRHAHAKNLWVALSSTPEEAVLTVEDDGVGRPSADAFDDDGVDVDAAKGGNGIIGMLERAKVLHGRCSADNRPEGGFRVRVSLPLKEPDDHAMEASE